ncbi:MAG: GerMN domain-containing protein, partial [bacterium]
ARNNPFTSISRTALRATERGRTHFVVTLLVVSVLVAVVGFVAFNRFFRPRVELPGISAPPRGETSGDTSRSPNKTAKIFFTRNGDGLAEMLMSVRADQDAATQASILVEALLRGPTSDDFKPLLPEGTKLRGLFVDDKIAVVDLSAEVLKPAPEQDCLTGELLAVDSIVNTILVNCEDLQKVLILIQGKPVDTLWGRVDLSEPNVGDLPIKK